MVVISCACPGCDYQSEDVTEPIACALLQSHSFSHATAASAVQAAVPAPVTENRGPRLERPHIGIGVSLEEWNVFTRRWHVFKAGSGIDDTSAPSQLFQFANRSVDFAGFRISESTVEPLPKYLNVIRDFPAPKNITDVRSWFGKPSSKLCSAP